MCFTSWLRRNNMCGNGLILIPSLLKIWPIYLALSGKTALFVVHAHLEMVVMFREIRANKQYYVVKIYNSTLKQHIS